MPIVIFKSALKKELDLKPLIAFRATGAKSDGKQRNRRTTYRYQRNRGPIRGPVTRTFPITSTTTSTNTYTVGTTPTVATTLSVKADFDAGKNFFMRVNSDVFILS